MFGDIKKRALTAPEQSDHRVGEEKTCVRSKTVVLIRKRRARQKTATAPGGKGWLIWPSRDGLVQPKYCAGGEPDYRRERGIQETGEGRVSRAAFIGKEGVTGGRLKGGFVRNHY